MKKRWLAAISLFFILVFAGSVAAEGLFDNVGGIVQKAVQVVAKIFTVSNWFGNSSDAGVLYIGFLRFCVWAITFAVFYYALEKAEMKRVGGIISFFLALIAAMFIPGKLLRLIGNVYGTIAVVGIIYGAIFGIGTLVYHIDASTRFGKIKRVALLVLVAVILGLIWYATMELVSGGYHFANTTGKVKPILQTGAAVAAAGGSEQQIDAKVIAGMSTATGIAFAFVVLWTLYELGRIFWEGTGGLLGRIYDAGPGGHHGGAGGGTIVHSGGISKDDLALMLKESNEKLKTELGENFAEVNRNVEKVHVLTAEIKGLCEKIIIAIDKITEYFEKYLEYFVYLEDSLFGPMYEQVRDNGLLLDDQKKKLDKLLLDMDALQAGLDKFQEWIVDSLRGLHGKMDEQKKEFEKIVTNTTNLIRVCGRIWNHVFLVRRTLEKKIGPEVNAIKGELQQVEDELTSNTNVLVGVERGLSNLCLDLTSVGGNVLRDLETPLTDVAAAVAGIEGALTALSATVAGSNAEKEVIGRVDAALRQVEDQTGNWEKKAGVLLNVASTAALSRLEDAAEKKIYGNNPESMVSKINEEIKGIIEIKPHARNAVVSYDSKYILAMNRNIGELVVLLTELSRALKTDTGKEMEATEAALNAVTTKLTTSASGVNTATTQLNALREKSETLLRRAEALVETSERVKEEKLKQVQEVREELETSLKFNEIELEYLNEIKNIVESPEGFGKKNSKQRKKRIVKLAKYLRRYEIRENRRANLKGIITQLENLGVLIEQKYLNDARGMLNSYENAQRVAFSNMFSEVKGKNLIEVKAVLVGMTGMRLGSGAEQLVNQSIGLIEIERRLLEMVKTAKMYLKINQ